MARQFSVWRQNGDKLIEAIERRDAALDRYKQAEARGLDPASDQAHRVYAWFRRWSMAVRVLAEFEASMNCHYPNPERHDPSRR